MEVASKILGALHDAHLPPTYGFVNGVRIEEQPAAAVYRRRGFQFVTLPEAERDEFYRQDTDLDLSPGADSLEQTMTERHLPLPPHALAISSFDTMCR